MNYDEMSDLEINENVLLAQDSCGDVESISHRNHKLKCINSKVIVKFKSTDEACTFAPCNNPSDAWLIIVDNGISIDFWGNCWAACIHHDNGVIFYHEDKNPLRAAMICFLKMKAQ